MRTATTSGRLTSSAVVAARGALLCHLMVETDGTNAATVILYDNASAASGTILAKMLVPGAAGHGEIVFDSPVEANHGIYCAISGTGAAAMVGYSLM